MGTWDKISLFKFQEAERIQKENIEDIDKLLFTVCTVFGFTEYQLDNMKLAKVNKMSAAVTKIFESEMIPVAVKRMGKYFIAYNPAKLTFGQYVELSFFLQMPLINAAHYILASITNKRFRKNNSAEHKVKADYFLTQPITKVVGTVKKFNENFIAFNAEYKSLFGVDEEVSGEISNDRFNRRYGWTYSASCIAEYERITLEQAYNIPIRQALNGLTYLKEKGIYEAAQLKKK